MIEIKKIKHDENPYHECKNCKTLADCPHPDVENNMFGTPMAPDICPRPIEIMKETYKNKKLRRISPY